MTIKFFSNAAFIRRKKINYDIMMYFNYQCSPYQAVMSKIY